MQTLDFSAMRVNIHSVLYPLQRIVITRPPPDHRTCHRLPSPGGSVAIDWVRGRELVHLINFIRLPIIMKRQLPVLIKPLPLPMASLSSILLPVVHFCVHHRFQSRIFICSSLAFLRRPSAPGILRRAPTTLALASAREGANSTGSSVECILYHVPCRGRAHVVRAMCQCQVALSGPF